MLTGDPHPTGFAKDLETMTFEHGATLASTFKKYAGMTGWTTGHTGAALHCL